MESKHSAAEIHQRLATASRKPIASDPILRVLEFLANVDAKTRNALLRPFKYRKETKQLKKRGAEPSEFVKSLPVVIEYLPLYRATIQYRAWLTRMEKKDSQKAALQFLMEECYAHRGERRGRANRNLESVYRRLRD